MKKKNHFIFVLFLYFFQHSSCRKDQFNVLILKFGTQDFYGSRSSKCPHWFVVVVLPSQVFSTKIESIVFLF